MIEVRVFEGLISLVATLFLTYGPWQWYCTDKARQELFIKRAHLFDLAVSGALSFSDTAYVLLRTHIERQIRFAHGLTWLRLLVIYLEIDNMPVSPQIEVTRAIEEISDADTRRALQKLYAATGDELVSMIVSKSMLILPLFALIEKSLDIGAKVARLNNWASALIRAAVVRKSNLIKRTDSIIRAEADAFHA